jgi:predicted transcriptional regulator
MGIVEASKLMRKYHVGSLVVVSQNSEGSIPIGIITDRDIVIEIIAEEVPIDSVTIKDVMTRSPVVLREDDNFFESINLMREKGIRRLPVTDSLGKLTGILAADDLLRFIYEELGNLVSLVYKEKMKEYKKRSE